MGTHRRPWGTDRRDLSCVRPPELERPRRPRAGCEGPPERPCLDITRSYEHASANTTSADRSEPSPPKRPCCHINSCTRQLTVCI